MKMAKIMESSGEDLMRVSGLDPMVEIVDDKGFKLDGWDLVEII
jgi:hypothetical protein